MVVGRKVHSGLWWGSRKHVLDLEIDYTAWSLDGKYIAVCGGEAENTY